MTQPIEINQYKNFAPAKNYLQDKVILITGAGSGIGRATAIGLASYGASIILLGKTLKNLEQVYDEIESLGYPKPAISQLDLETATELEYEQLLGNLHAEFGKLDGLLHNASVLGELCPLELMDKSLWDKVIQVNLTANFQLTQKLLPMLKLSDDASIVFTSSGVGRKGRAYWGPYAVSKFATEGLMQVLADELETNTNIRVNSLNPGATRTSMRASAYPGEDAKTLPTPEQLLPAYLFLFGEDSQQLNGEALNARDFFDLTPSA